MLIIPAAVLASCCGDNRTAKVPAIDITNFDTSAAVNEDFYRYAVGGWQQKNPLRPEYSRYGAFDALRENNEYRAKELFADLSSKKNEKGTVAQKITDLYNLGLDSVRLNAEGASPVSADLASIDALKDGKDVSRWIASMHRSVAAPFFAPYVEADMMNASDNILYLAQAGMGMGNRDYYLDEENENIRDAYKTYIKRLFELAGYGEKDADAAVKSVMEVETALAGAAYSNVELRDPYKNYNMVSAADFRKRFDAVDWDMYFETLGIDMPAQINVSQIPAMEKANALMATLPMETMKDYLRFHYLNSAASYLSDDFVKARFDFYGRTLSGQEEQQPRWKRALGVPNSVLSEAVGEMYVAKYFPPEYKERMLGLVRNLQKALSQHIDSLEWMSDETKARAQEKLASFYVKIGYPDKWKDYSSLEIDASLPYWENLKRASVWETDDNLADLGKPVDKDKWYMSPQTVNAYYNPTTNEICFPAAILQPPFFNPDADDAVNYGAIGVVIGHEMTHGFDDQGRQFDKDGNLNDWWTAEDAAQFKQRADKLAAQFDAVEVLPGVFANGRLTLGENIADQGGLRVAYTAMYNSFGDSVPQPVDGLTADQRFYLSYATAWAQNIRDEEIARLTKLDPHALAENRVNVTLRNVDTFYDAFDITDGAMYLAPQERVVIW